MDKNESEKTLLTNNDENNVSELEDSQTKQVAGGASWYLTGAIVTNRVARARLGGVGSFSNKVAAKSLTTLGCWEECTVNISGC